MNSVKGTSYFPVSTPAFPPFLRFLSSVQSRFPRLNAHVTAGQQEQSDRSVAHRPSPLLCQVAQLTCLQLAKRGGKCDMLDWKRLPTPCGCIHVHRMSVLRKYCTPHTWFGRINQRHIPVLPCCPEMYCTVSKYVHAYCTRVLYMYSMYSKYWK